MADGQYTQRYSQADGSFIGVVRTSDGAFIPESTANRDWQDFLIWQAIQSPMLDLSDGAAPATLSHSQKILTAKAAATGNVSSLSGTTTLDTVSVIAGDIVFLPFQTTTTQRGLWEIKAGAWTRPVDFATGDVYSILPLVVVAQGARYGASVWGLSVEFVGGSVTVGATGQLWTRLVTPYASADMFAARLTGATGVPVTITDQTGKSNLFLSPYNGNAVHLYNTGTGVWEPYALTSDYSIALGTLTADKNYDVFIYISDGALTHELVAWTDDTTRTTGLEIVHGRIVKASSTRRYAGSFRTTSTTTTEDSERKRFVFSAYNRVPRKVKRIETTDSWAGGTADAWVKGNSSSTNRIEVLRGLDVEPVILKLRTVALNDTSVVIASGGIGVDSDSANSADTYGGVANTTFGVPAFAEYEGFPGVGWHYLQWLEQRGSGGNTTWYGDAGGGVIQSGMVGVVWS